MSTTQEKIDAVLGAGTPKVSKSALRSLMYNINVEYVEITATRNLADFNSIREILATITDATDSKRYIVNVPAGEWFECDIQGKNYVEIHGEGIDKTIIYCDGLSSNETPTDYSFTAEKNKALSTVDGQWKHVIYAKEDVYLKNLTIRANNVKYCMHIDNSLYDSVYCENVKFHALTAFSIIGCGSYGGQSFMFEKCIFQLDTPYTGYIRAGIYVHNWDGQSLPSVFSVYNSHFIGCPYAMVDGMNSGQDDEFNLINCTNDSVRQIAYRDAYVDSHYAYRVNATGTLIEKAISINGDFNDTMPPVRPDFLYKINSGYSKKSVIAGVNAGNLIQGISYKFKNDFSVYDGTKPFVGIAITSTDADGYVFVAVSGQIAKAPVTGVAANYVKINVSNELEFESTKTADTVGINLGLFSTGIYEIKIL